MHFMYFTERPYLDIPEDEVFKRHGFFGLPNKYFNPEKAAVLYNEYLDERLYAEELGIEGLMLNEHHGTPFTMGSVMDVEAAILARITKKVKIVLLGNALPVVRNPLRLAEELAMIDVISHGRLVSGFVRGVGTELLSNDSNPAYNREYFNEAHDLIVKAWTTPGPFRFEGNHFQYRMVNPWVLPLQKPHPPIWVPGLVSPESVIWCAKHRYPYVALATVLQPTIDICNLYAETAASEGYQAGPENFGYLTHVFVAETDEKAQELGRRAYFGGGINNFGRPEWMAPSGYNSKETTRRLARAFAATDLASQQQAPIIFFLRVDDSMDVDQIRKAAYANNEQEQAAGVYIVGSPKTVITKLVKLLEVLRPGILGLWQNDGPIPREARLTSIRLLAQEVLPVLRERARELELTDPFERKPGSRPLPASGRHEPVTHPEALSA
jgi:alkanesulfonate monooxygenase SsuD/methylene tetrahydromethanopterin reductase-like flavin-dependent oxidoreductase (luciferase family)